MSRGSAIGASGEAIACRYLTSRGFVVLARNYRTSIGEIDIVARDGDEVVVVEVKTRVGGAEVAPDLAVTAAKLDRLACLAELYLQETRQADSAWRVDVVAVVVDRDGAVVSIEHIPGAYL